MITTGHSHEMIEVRNRNPNAVAVKQNTVMSYNQNARGIVPVGKLLYYTAKVNEVDEHCFLLWIRKMHIKFIRTY